MSDILQLMTPWAERLNADLDTLDSGAEFPWDKWSAVQESGILRTPFDPRYGGHGRSLTETMLALEGLGRVSRDSGLSFSASTQIVSVGVPLQRFADDDLKDRFLPKILSGDLITAHAITEESGGSDAMNIATTAVREGDHYVVNGAKMFITNAPVADLFLLYVRTGAPGPFGLTCLLVEAGTPGLKAGPPLDKIGLRTSPLGTLAFEELRVPVAQRVGGEGTGFLVLDYVMKREVLFAFSITLGEMTRRLAETIRFAKERTQFGQSIGKYQAISHKVADMKIRTETARKWLHDTGVKVESGQDAAVDLAATKTVVSEANVQNALDAVRIHGGRGVLTAHGVERALRDSVAGTIYSGTSEIQRTRIASLLGL
ncbi:acyl-CoA dehydrogenase family protein [Streptomyces sp. S.PB5]|uniref:acyl-CoA dehydrogenase family protein n=1 Tax=Streptomyces sp. S.PB5 TaxID=3020844 RepID=UPI0025B1E7E2|nr:acyl-CoA dehydrogenase family protein [Streptomyces sp. S.PB5]MDN3026455.1 acyl-CoA dehydrogenase family protein [Streptomyces sp. S.PB5]